ncbi:Complement factor I [Portunus trituberculatus]|uniref:Complement factor I n=1 Tax=Portunus trituberculatus TaxID=210409 RepID=A0A5B7D667_PORTR|nr:Complement factor I [Portunus trituberculatus]
MRLILLLLLLVLLTHALLSHAMPKPSDDFTFQDEDMFEEILASEPSSLQENSQEERKGDRNAGGGSGRCASDHMFICAGGEEVCEVQKCDGVQDCPMADDEDCGDGGGCDGDHIFICASGKEICDVQVCDGLVDCPMMDDEAGCSE